jgi:hypothetical protein
MGVLLIEKRSGLILDALLTPASGTAERAAAETMLGGQAGGTGRRSVPTRV